MRGAGASSRAQARLVGGRAGAIQAMTSLRVSLGFRNAGVHRFKQNGNGRAKQARFGDKGETSMQRGITLKAVNLEKKGATPPLTLRSFPAVRQGNTVGRPCEPYHEPAKPEKSGILPGRPGCSLGIAATGQRPR
ncbi:MAG: hypothetical protein LBC51_09830 [Treponema sp.]|nr:hypothetical protein [Treponema sp.]